MTTKTYSLVSTRKENMVSNSILIGHWPLQSDTKDHSDNALETRCADVELVDDAQFGGAGRFNGRTSKLEIGNHPALNFGHDEFTFAAWIHTDAVHTDVVGDLFGRFDSTSRRGINLCLLTNTGVTSTAQPNRRHLQFGIDDARLEPEWQDCGRPGNAVLVTSLLAADGLLYVGTLETGAKETGHLFRYDGGKRWVDLGNPAGTNAVHSVTEFEGAIYCAAGRYATAGSCLGNTILNNTRGGQIYRVEENGEWTCCGHPGLEETIDDDKPSGPYNLGKADDSMSLTSYRGNLYCVSNHMKGVFKYEGGQEWKKIGLDSRVITLTIYRGELYALGNGGPVYRYLGDDEWKDCGRPGDSTQTYGAAIHKGRFYVGTWPEGTIHRYEGDGEWPLVGRAGYEREVMAMANYHGKVYAGGLPTGSVYRIDGSAVTMVANLDASPVVLRRVWSMAVFGGSLYAGTLPSGRVYKVQAGRCTTWDQTFPGGWHHVVAVKGRRQLKLYVDGRCVSQSDGFHRAEYNLDTDAPLTIGFGAFEHFCGLMSDVRLYRGGLDDIEVRALSTV